jgi:hypothetical protein
LPLISPASTDLTGQGTILLVEDEEGLPRFDSEAGYVGVCKEFSEQCAKLAAEVFQKKWGGEGTKYADGRTTVSKYESHYNSRLKKCLYLEVRDSSQSGKAPLRMMDLVDLQENKTIGSYSKIAGDTFVVCSVQGTRCYGEDAWRALVKSFMED